MKQPIIDVLIVSYGRDSSWFRQSLKVLTKNLTGYRQIILVCPSQDRATFAEIARDTGAKLKINAIPDWPGAGYLWQQWVKIHADEYSTAPFIAHLDSDVFIKSPMDLSSCFVDGKPTWLWSRHDALTPDAQIWRVPTETATGWVCDQDFMCGFPFILERATYKAARAHLQAKHGIGVGLYLQSRNPKAGHPDCFSEFNFIGRVAWEHRHEAYNWVDRNSQPWPEGFHHTKQFWSHSPLADCIPEIQQMLHGGSDPMIRTTRMGIWVLSNDSHISKWVEQCDRLDHDQAVLPRLLRYIKPGDTVVDVGAFIGDHTIAYARATHGVDSGRVLAFEPNLPAFECLRRNMTGLAHVECINAGLANEAGQMTIQRESNAGASHLIKGGGIPIKTLDSYNLQRLNFLKIDAEGMELAILIGARQTIMRCRPTMYIEVNRAALDRAGTSASELLTYLRLELKYKISGIENGPQFDVLCQPKEIPVTPVVLVLGVSHREVHLGRLWLRWVSHLCAQPGGDNSKNTLVIFVNRRTTQEQRQQLLAEVGDAKDGMFKTLLAEPHDEQERGYPGSASHLFVRALEHVEKNFPGAATLWCEADTVAIRPSWFREIVDEYQACGMPFMGGQAGLGDFRHMTGNAIYPPDWRTLAPLLLDSFVASDSEYWGEGKGEPWDVFARSQVMPRMHLCKTIQQIWRPARFTGLGQILPDTALFHQCKEGSLVAQLAEKYPGFVPPQPLNSFAMLNRYTSVEVEGRSFPFTVCQFHAGMGWESVHMPVDFYEELELHLLAARQVGIEVMPQNEARERLAKAARSRLQKPPVNTLRF